MTYKCKATTIQGRQCSKRLDAGKFCHIHQNPSEIINEPNSSENHELVFKQLQQQLQQQKIKDDFNSINLLDFKLGPLYAEGYLYLALIILVTYFLA
jgi:hypothetical protein